MSAMAPQSAASWFFTQPFIRTQIKENIKVPRHWPLWGNSPVTSVWPTQKASDAEKNPVDDVIMIYSLTHWGLATHICVSKLIIIGSDNGLSPSRSQAIIWTNAGILLIRPLGTKLTEILIEIHIFSFNKMHLKMPSAKWRPFCLGLNVLT